MPTICFYCINLICCMVVVHFLLCDFFLLSFQAIMNHELPLTSNHWPAGNLYKRKSGVWTREHTAALQV